MSESRIRIDKGTQAAVLLGVALLLGGCAPTPEDPDSALPGNRCAEGRGAPTASAAFRSLSNPLEASAATVAAGRALYEDAARPVACAQCHGLEGDGQGPLAHDLEPAPSNFTCDFYRDVPDGQLFWITQEGSNFMRTDPGHVDVERPGRRERRTAMRPHRYHLSETETWQIIAYLRTFHAEDD